MIVADEFRDGNVPAGMGNLRIIQKAVAALPGKFNEIRLRHAEGVRGTTR